MPELMLRYRAASWFVRAYAPEIAMGLKTAEEVQDTYDLEPAEDGTYRVSVQEMKEEAQDKDTPSKRSRPTNAEMEARRKEAADAWLATGNPLEDVEKLVNAYARNWTTAQCEKAKQLAAEAMRNGAQQDAPEVSEQPEAQPAPAANMITCPQTETQVSDWPCSDCDQRAGCPAWAE